MLDILALLQCLAPTLQTTTLHQFSRVILAMLVMTGRVTMLGIARWSGTGGSYRTVQRFFHTAMPWATLFWLFFRQHLHRPDDTYLLAGDEVVVTKAGQHTYGLDRFFSGLYHRPVPGLAFFALSLISVQARRSYPIRIKQVVRTEKEKAASPAQARAKPSPASAEKRKPGRPKGRKTQLEPEVALTPELTRIQAMIQALLKLIAGHIQLTYLVLDGHFGNHPGLCMAQHCALHLISKLRCDAALYSPYDGPYAGRGARRKYGDKLDYRNLPAPYLKATTLDGQIETRIYQARLLHKEFKRPLNAVILVKTNLKTGAWAHVILFSSDLDLAYDRLIDYYSLRFQIEFNFRDAKQYWGLEDFMAVTPIAVTNAANLSLFMVDVTHRLLRDFRQANSECSILDLKAYCRGYKYVAETIKLLPEKPEPISLAQIFDRVTCLGRIHAVQPGFRPS